MVIDLGPTPDARVGGNWAGEIRSSPCKQQQSCGQPATAAQKCSISRTIDYADKNGA